MSPSLLQRYLHFAIEFKQQMKTRVFKVFVMQTLQAVLNTALVLVFIIV